MYIIVVEIVFSKSDNIVDKNDYTETAYSAFSSREHGKLAFETLSNHI
jgi:hypothetical protein